jgi:glycosyltransferase involved in cell wall biosynthesis
VPEPALSSQVVPTPAEARPLLSVVVPVYNLAGAIADNARTIRERVEGALGEQIELIVVSDGSSDSSEERVLESGEVARVIHYDRNLGKGYAVKAGALVSAGRFVSYVDADLDLDPAALADYLRLAERESLDIVIGSKRHPDSVVNYPRSRRAGSWLYQKLVRVLFRLDVRDTQVGLKLFRREVAEQVLPLLIVKQFAFDLEFLAVARSLGFDRIREQPVTLRYRFTGSGVRSPAVLLALVDTAAIFYRLRLVHYYRRKRALMPEYARVREYRPKVSVVASEPPPLDYPDLEAVALPSDTPEGRLDALGRVDGEVVAFLETGATAARNWLASTVPMLANPEIAAVVTPSMTPAKGSIRQRAAAAVSESLLGGGSTYFRFTPGNLRFVRQFPATNVVARKADLEALPPEALHPHKLCRALDDAGRKVLYSPETVVVVPRPELFRPHLEEIAAAGRVRGQAIREHGLGAVTAASVPPVALLLFTAFGWPLLLAGDAPRLLWFSLWGVYGLAILATGALAALRFQSLQVGALTVAGVVAVHVVYAGGLLRGLLSGEAGR